MPGGEKRQMVLLNNGDVPLLPMVPILLYPFRSQMRFTVAVTSHPSDTGGVEVVQGYPVNLSAFRLGAAVYQGGSFAPSSNLNGIWFAKAK
ncbi:hypothetical protein ACFQUX_05015 [Pantoea stewartii]